jgi:lysyl-tRNA synthetase class 2
MEHKLNDQEINKRNKLKRLQSENHNPFVITKFQRNFNTVSFKKAFERFTKEELHENNSSVILAGRVMAIRQTFGVIKDFYGQVQFYINKKKNEEVFNTFTNDIDIGDIIGVEGTPMKTNTGEITVNIQKITLLSKSLKPLPEK